MRVREKLAWMVAATLALFVIASVVTEVAGGPLDPPGSPAPTMRTLDGLLPAWAEQRSATGGCTSSRFACFGDETGYVLDRETGLVWQRSVGRFGVTDFYDGNPVCDTAGFGGRYGWRLPSAPELLTLLDAGNVNPVLSLPSGHPFLDFNGVPGEPFWTTDFSPYGVPNADYVVEFKGLLPGDAGRLTEYQLGVDEAGVWCVRGA